MRVHVAVSKRERLRLGCAEAGIDPLELSKVPAVPCSACFPYE
jgi:hypothetical protein